MCYASETAFAARFRIFVNSDFIGIGSLILTWIETWTCFSYMLHFSSIVVSSTPELAILISVISIALSKKCAIELKTLAMVETFRLQAA